MDHLDQILWDDPCVSDLVNLCVHIQTAGVYQSKVTVDPFDFEICDVGGSRSARKKWIYCIREKLDYVIYVVDLDGYCHTMREDNDTASSRSAARRLNTDSIPTESDVGVT